MTKRRQQSRSAFALLVTAICALDAWAGWQWAASRQEVTAAQTQLAESERMAERIAALRVAPVLVEEQVRSSETLAKLVEAAARKSGLEMERIVHISPGSPRRIADSAYKEQATELELREVTLRQLIELTVAIRESAPGMQVPTLTMRVPPGDENAKKSAEVWNVQLLLTSHIYSPTITPSP